MKIKELPIVRQILIVSIALFLISLNSHAQSCSDVFELCPPNDKLFNKQAFARSYKIKPKQKLQLVQVFYGGTGYHINLCKEDFLGDFRIRLLDFATKKVLWDNATDKFTTSISISFGSTQRIFLEVTPQNPENFRGMSRCLGIVVRYYRDEELRDTPPSDPETGF